MVYFWQVDIMIWQVNILNWQVNIKIWQVDIIIRQVMAELCHYTFLSDTLRGYFNGFLWLFSEAYWFFCQSNLSQTSIYAIA